MRREYETDKQTAVSKASSGSKQEVDKARRQGEEKAREGFAEEMRKYTAKHKAEISATKKKQWVSERNRSE